MPATDGNSKGSTDEDVMSPGDVVTLTGVLKKWADYASRAILSAFSISKLNKFKMTRKVVTNSYEYQYIIDYICVYMKENMFR